MAASGTGDKDKRIVFLNWPQKRDCYPMRAQDSIAMVGICSLFVAVHLH